MWVANFGSLLGSIFGSLLVTINVLSSLITSTWLSESFVIASTYFLESIIWSTCLAESFLNQFLLSTCSSESFISSTYFSYLLCVEPLIVDWIVHTLKFSTISARTLEASHISNDVFASCFCTFIAIGDWNEVSHVMLLMLHSIYSSSSSMTRRTASLRFLLENLWPWRLLY